MGQHRDTKKCCGIGTAGTVIFCLSETGTEMHYGSGSNIKCNKKVIKSKNGRPNFWEIMVLLTLKRQDFFNETLQSLPNYSAI
jgi:hypothetical protein